MFILKIRISLHLLWIMMRWLPVKENKFVMESARFSSNRTSKGNDPFGPSPRRSGKGKLLFSLCTEVKKFNVLVLKLNLHRREGLVGCDRYRSWRHGRRLTSPLIAKHKCNWPLTLLIQQAETMNHRVNCWAKNGNFDRCAVEEAVHLRWIDVIRLKVNGDL